MKRIISLLICVTILMASICIIAAANTNIYTYEIDGYEYTVEISDDGISNEKKQSIADALVGTNEPEIMTANLWCSLFGHDYRYTNVSVTQHKVNVYNPRCKLQFYDVTYCDDCDYTEQTLISNSYICCCPED